MKKVEQILKNGNIKLDFDEKLNLSEISTLMNELFNPMIKKDDKQFVLFNKIAVLVCNVTYLGNPHPLYKKRIQLKSYYLDYLKNNVKKGLTTIYLGIYSYKQTKLFVVFEPSTYENKKSHNSSAHVYSTNLQYAQRAGKFEKIDKFGNKIFIFKRNSFIKYIKMLAGEGTTDIDGDTVIALINERFSDFSNKIENRWNGIECYKQMLESNDPNSRQAEWPGFYFEYIFKKYLQENEIIDIEWHSEKKRFAVDLDLLFDENKWIYGDLKADQINHAILGNSIDTLDSVINDHHGTVFYVCCLYKSYKDSENNYEVTKYWNSLRDKPYSTEEEMKARYGRKMKYAVEPIRICVLKIDPTMYSILKQRPFKQGINSDGKEREPKLKVDKNMIEALSIFSKDLKNSSF